MPLTAIVFWIVYIGGVCGAVAVPAIGVALYVLVYHVNPGLQWWGSSVSETGLRPSLTVALGTLLGVFLRRASVVPGTRLWQPPVVLGLALIGYAIFTRAWATSYVSTDYLVEKVAKMAVFFVLLVYCVRTPRDYQLLFMGWVAGITYICYEAWGQVGVMVGGRLTFGLGGPDFAESSGLSVHLTASLPLVAALFFMVRKWWSRGLVLFIAALTVNTIILTRTRNALAGLGAMAVCIVFWLPRGYRARGIAAIVVGALLTLQLADPGWWDRMATVFDYREDTAATSRLVYWRAALEMAKDHPMGVGLGQFNLLVSEYVKESAGHRSVHSTFMACLADLGFPGMILLLGMIFLALHHLAWVKRSAGGLPADETVSLGMLSGRFNLRWHAMALQCALVGYLACGLFTTRLWTEGFWILIAMTCALTNIACAMRHETEAFESAEQTGAAGSFATSAAATGGPPCA